MGWVLMSERRRTAYRGFDGSVFGPADGGFGRGRAGDYVRQVNCLLIRLRENGGGRLIHKGRGQSSNHRLSPGIRAYALELVSTKYADFGPTWRPKSCSPSMTSR